MFLKCLDINGFKSFADKTHIDFADGITSLLGPNGCGKSNIVDSIKWVLGEHSTKSLRASKMEDCIFNGTDNRKPLQFAEVALTLDNSERLLPSDMTEIEIKRRAFRSGENEYYINKNRCLLKNIRELFFDTGVGKSAYSILEQGKIDQILSSKPEDRRYIFEEAAGISRFNQECNEAQKKIQRTEENISQVELIIKSEKRTYDNLRNQAEKAMQYSELSKKLLSLDADLHILKVKTYQDLKSMRSERVVSLKADLERVTNALETSKEEIERFNRDVRETSEKSHNLNYALNRAEEAVNGVNDRIHMLEDRYRDYLTAKQESDTRCVTIQSNIDRDSAQLEEMKEQLADKKDQLAELNNQVRRANGIISDDQKQISNFSSLIHKEEDAISDNDMTLASLSIELKDVIEDLAHELDEKMGEEYSLSRRSSAEKQFRDRLVSIINRFGEKRKFYQNLPSIGAEAFSSFSSDLESVLNDLNILSSEFDAFKNTIPPFLDSLLAPEGLLTKKRHISEREESARSEIEKSREKISSYRQSSAELQAEIDSLRTTVEQMNMHVANLTGVLSQAETTTRNLERAIEEKKLDLSDAQSASSVAELRIQESNELLKKADQEKLDLKQRADEIRSELTEVQAEISRRYQDLTRKEQERNNVLESINTIKNDIEKNEMLIGNCDEHITELFSSFFNTYSRNLMEFSEREKADLPEQVLLENELAEVRKQIQALGPNINHMAVDDFKEAKERYDFYVGQLDDLNKAKGDLEKVLMEIQGKSEELFLQTYKKISDNFQEMFKRLFNGGRAEITLADPENVLSSGIDIFAQPPGKKLISLSLLSGGERSMTAVALLFATYMVKPSPFCILDEIDAALDDKNIGYFLSVLDDFGKNSQFIIITHNKHTVLGSNSLLGVTQMEAGVSTTVTYKLARVEGEAVILNENQEKVDFDEEGRRT
ncbi:MAG: AAA family ATPase [Sphaerochaetaceae bacterium]|nr:AAA family ATPase [Sphaerochaetaceae bacterium]